MKTGLFILFFLNTWYSLFSQNTDSYQIDFYHLTVKKGGIAANSITSITQDTLGQMWFSTKNGVIRYNGKKMFLYKHIPDSINSVADNFTNKILVTKNGTLFVISQKGVNRYNFTTDYFEPFDSKNNLLKGSVNDISEDRQHNVWFLNYSENTIVRYIPKQHTFKAFKVPYKKIGRLLIDKKNRIWITTAENFFLQFNSDKKTFDKIKLIPDKEYRSLPKIKSFADNFTQDSEGYLWFGTHFGYLLRFNPETEKIERFYFRKNLYPRNHFYVMFLKEDTEKNLWFGTWFDGLYKLSKNRQQITHFMPEKNKPNSLSNSISTCAYQDKGGYMWFGTEFAGINILKKNKKFFTIAYKPKQTVSLPALPYLCSATDSSGKVWAGTDVGGLWWFYRNRPDKVHKFSFGKEKAERIFSLLTDSKQNLWIGTENGLFKYNLKNKKLIHYKHKKEDYNSISGKYIISLCEDKKGNIWAGSIYKGLSKLNTKTGKIYRFEYDKDNPAGLCNNYISALYCDKLGNIWIGTLDGLNKFNPENGVFSVFKYNCNNPAGLSSNKINCFCRKDDNLWIGTEGGGLNKYNFTDKKFSRFLKKDGLISDNVKGINYDNNGNLWISTTHNISKFNPKTKQFTIYGKSDGLYNQMYITDYGLQELEFFEKFSNKDKDGYLYFGGIGGIYIFHPDSLPQNSYKPPVIIENFFINGKKTSINKDSTLILKPSRNNLKISLSVLNFIQSDKNKYAYFLENYDTAWIYSGNKYQINYYNLPPGTYFFHYKGANNDGIWSKTNKPVKIIIRERFYNTIWFYIAIFAFSLILLTSFILYKQYVKKQLKKKKELLRYTSSNLSKDFINEKNSEMLQFLETKKPYSDPDLSLQKLALSLNTKPNYLSQIINTKHNCNFRDFINKYRIETAKELLLNTNLKIEAVAYDSGFNTLSTFNAVFKKETGTTPSKFRNNSEK